MKPGRKSPSTPLRRKAEEVVNKKSQKKGLPLSEAETLKLFHELEVHQVELELQNEELIKARTEYKNIADKYTELYDFAPTGYFSISKGGKIIDLNLKGSQILGITRSKAKNAQFELFIAGDSRAGFTGFLNRMITSHVHETCELILSATHDTARYILVAGILGEKGDQCLLSVADITARKQIEIALHKSEAQYRTIAENFPNGMLALYDHDLRYLAAGGEGLKKIGLSSSDLIGKRLRDVFPPEVFKRDEPALKAALRGEISEVVVSYENDVFRVITLPVINENGVIVNGMVVTQNITELKRKEKELKESERYLKETQAIARLGSYKLDIKAGEWQSSKILNEIFGIDEKYKRSVEGWLKLIHPDCREEMADYLNHQVVGKQKRFDKTYKIIRNDDKTERWVHGYGELELGNNNQPAFMIGTIQDITKQKLIEEKIQLLNNELEDRIEQRTHQLVEANREMEAFAYSISHDLRAPLRAINGYSEIFKAEFHDKVDAEGKRLIDNVIRNAVRMGHLIDDLLEFFRLGRHHLVTSPVNMQKMLEEVVNEISSQQKGRKIEVKINTLEPCTADPSMIRQVWMNLVSNAFKYSGKNESARIEIGSYTENSSICYYVKDNGIGFDMQYNDKLFKVFQRLHSSTDFGGTGVGLALVKQIVIRHGGKVWAKGKLNEGAIFYFTIPI